jgi:predicted RNA-binding protein associated with RNAse of E/G family
VASGPQLNPGDVVCLRDVVGNEVAWAWPAAVVADDGDTLVAAQLLGGVGMVPEGYPDDRRRVIEQAVSRSWTLVPLAWRFTNVLHVLTAGQWWSTKLMWDAASGEFLCWYVDLRVPIVRRGCNVDSRDLQLDLVVGLDGSWTWKDEDHLALAVDAGFISAEEHAAVEATRPVIVAAVEAKGFPFDDSLRDWRPDGLALPVLHEKWARP